MRFVLFLIFAASVAAQDNFPITDDSYVSYPAKEGLVFEGQIAPDYPVINWGNTSEGWSGSVVITPKVILKMYRKESNPVHDPSYMPKITFEAAWKSGSIAMYPFLILSHHSNGQSGDTFVEDKDKTTSPLEPVYKLNTESGSFSTNFIQAGYYVSLPALKHHYVGLSYEHHPVHGWWFGIDPVIRDMYGRKRLHYDYRYASEKLQIDLNYTKLLEKPEILRSNKIFAASVKVRSPYISKNLWYFASFYRGQDYYNIYFTENINQIKMGLALQTRLVIN